MTTITTTDEAPAVSTSVKAGLVLAIILGLANIPFVLAPTPDGQEAPPMIVLVFALILGVLSIITAMTVTSCSAPPEASPRQILKVAFSMTRSFP